MNLWIRSQDKRKLLTTTYLSFMQFENDDCINILASAVDNSPIGIGRYKTEERALEILDEIQILLKGKYVVNTYKDNNVDIKRISGDVVIYEMPEE